MGGKHRTINKIEEENNTKETNKPTNNILKKVREKEVESGIYLNVENWGTLYQIACR